jgi:hypothetical protein
MRWWIVLTLAACSCGDNAAGTDGDAGVDGAGAPDGQPLACMMTVTAATKVTGPCTFVIAPHGPHGYDASTFHISSSSPPADFLLRDYTGTFYSPPRAQLNDQLADVFLTFSGSATEGGNTYQLSMPPNPTGSFSLSLDAGPLTAPGMFASGHGSLDATLLGAGGTATLHARF